MESTPSLPACLLPPNLTMESTPSLPSNTLFVADIPSHVTQEDFVSIFSHQEGLKNARLRKDRNNHAVGFADFEDSESASFAMETLQGYKWSVNDQGITIHFSNNATNPSRRPENERSTHVSRADRNFGHSSSSREAENGRSGLTVPFMPDLVSPQQNPPQLSSHPNYGYPNIFPTLPNDASSTLYVEGLPADATEREIAHIFRPFPGYQSLRILTKESKQNPSRVYNLCFVEFDNKYQATFALNHLQGYRLDKDDTKGLSMTYAKSERKPRQPTKLKSPSTQRNE